MTTQHTPGRLDVVNDTGEWAAEYDAEGTTCSVGLVTESGSMVALAVAYSPNIFADPDPTANARRLVACWNACEGINTLLLEQLRVPLRDLNGSELALLEQRDELLDALKDLCNDIEEAGATPLDRPAYYKARAAIAKAEGGAK